jgi:hypothetical protein
MPAPHLPPRRCITARRALALGLPTVALALAACATGPEAQWIDPQWQQGKSFKGASVLVACDAYEPVVKQICRDQLAEQVRQRGGRPVMGPDAAPTSPWRPQAAADLLPAARQAGAAAVLSAVVQPGLSTPRPGPSIGFGVGTGGVGVGISTPIGGGRSEPNYSADGVLTEVASGRLVWTAKVSSAASSDVAGQVSSLARQLVDAVGKAGLL